jgi:hypothetical protein
MKLTPEGKLHERLVAEIKAKLYGNEPAIQSSVLAELLAIYLVGFARPHREEVLNDHVAFVRQLVPVVEGIAYGGAGHPDDRH